MKFECDRCGECCRQLIIEIDQLDIAREPKFLNLTTFKTPEGWSYAPEDEDDIEEYERIGPLVPGFEAGAMLACGASHPCPMLGADKLCTIYPTRPNCCVAMQAGSNQCQQARGMAGLAPLQPIS